jgi:hypothetical protein
MDTKQKEKLTRYLRNAQPFLWGVISGNKKAVLATLRTILKELGEDSIPLADNQKPTYTMLADSLLAKLGIEKVIREIVAVQVRRQFADRQGALEFLRAHWLSGTLPRWQTLQTLRAPRTMKQKLLEAAHPSEVLPGGKLTGDILDAFVEVNTQYKYVHGWTVFAGLWFEEIEPLLNEAVEK